MSPVRWTIKRKLLALGAATFVPLLAVLALWAGYEVRVHTAEAEEQVVLASHQAARQVEALLDVVKEHVRALARDPELRRAGPDRLGGLFRRITAAHPDFENVFAVSPDGDTIASALPPAPGSPGKAAGLPWLSQALATGETVVGSFQIGHIVGEPVVVVATPLWRGGSSSSAVLAISMSLRRPHALFQSLPLPRGMSMTVVDGEGVILAHSRRGRTLVGRRLSLPPASPGGRQEVARIAGLGEGREIVGMAGVAGSDWRVLVGVPEAAIREGLRREVGVIALPVLALMAVSSLVGFLVARRVWRPLQALTEAAGRLGREGNLAPVPVSASDEVGELARVFNAMAAEVTRSRAGLERRVSELGALHEAGRLLTGTLALPDVLDRLAGIARTQLGADVARIWLLDAAADSLVLRAHQGVTREEVDFLTRLGREEGLAGWIMVHRTPLTVAEVLDDPRLKNKTWMRAEGVVSFLGVPLLKGDAPVGILACLFRARRDFSDEEVALAEAVAAQAAVAIEHAGLYEETERRRRTAESLAEVGRLVTRSLDLEEVAQRIVESVRALLDVRSSVLFRLDETSGDLVSLASSGGVEDIFGRNVVFPRGTGAAGIAVAERRPVAVPDLLADPRVALPHEVRARARDLPYRAVLAVPLVVHDRVIGALSVAAVTGRTFSPAEVGLAQAFADQATVALENARLFEETRQALADLRKAQEELVRGATMRALGELASGTAHHLNNLLAIVLGRVRLLLAARPSGSSRRPLEIIERAAADAAEVVRRVSRFARARPVEEVGPVDLGALAAEVVEMTRGRWQDQAQAQGVRIDVTVEGGELPPVVGNSAALREALINVILNAVEALPGGGRIGFRTFLDGGWACLAVRDTGVGMPPEVRERAVEPFYTTKGPKSTGLGLSAAYGILRRHGGDLRIESEKGQGTTVTLRLPVAAAGEGERRAAAAGGADASPSLRILVIDDDAEVRETVVEMLAGEGHAALQAPGGREGLALLEAGERVDLVLTDLGMPGMNGWEVARAVKARWPELPVWILTGWGDQLDEASSDRRAVAGVLSKPVAPEDLRQMVAARRGAA